MTKFNVFFKFSIVSLSIIFCLNSCGLLGDSKSYESGYTESENIASISENNLIGISDTMKVRVYGNIKWIEHDYSIFPYYVAEVFLKNNSTHQIYTTTTDFDGIYNFYIDSGKYDMMIKKIPEFPENYKIGLELEFKSGEIREINITTQEQITTVSIGYKNRRAFKKAHRKKN